MSEIRLEPIRVRHLIGGILGALFLLFGAIPPLVYIQRDGFAIFTILAVAVVAAEALFLVRALTRSMSRPGKPWLWLRSVWVVIVIVGPVLLLTIAYSSVLFPIPHHDEGLLAVVAVMSFVVLLCALLGVRREAKEQAEMVPRDQGL
jgi:choline-glycine betaine transporter